MVCKSPSGTMAFVGMTGGRGDGHNPLSCKCGALSAVRAEGYTQFLGSISPANRVERTRTNMSVGHAMKPMSEAHFAILRRHMVEAIGIQIDLASEELGKSAFDDRVLAAMGKVPRHRFVPSFLAPLAYQDTPLPIGFDKTISQPFIVALMTDLLGPEPHESILEVGTGLGYHAAVLAELSGRVWSVEIVEELAGQAEANLRQLGCSDVAIRIGDGSRGWREHADGVVIVSGDPARRVGYGELIGGRYFDLPMMWNGKLGNDLVDLEPVGRVRRSIQDLIIVPQVRGRA